MTLLTRRLLLTAAALGGLGVRPAAPAAASDRRADALRALIPDPAAARPLGRAYRAAVPGEGADLDARLLQSLGLDRARLARLSEAELRRRIQARVRQDFVQGQTIVIGGWVLSRTEGRLAALWE